MLTYNQPLLQLTLRGLQPSVCLRLWSPKFICDTLWNGSFLQPRNKICSASLEDIWTHRLPSSSDTCTTQFLQVANYKLRTTLAEASGNFWLCAASKTNKYLLFWMWIYVFQVLPMDFRRQDVCCRFFSNTYEDKNSGSRLAQNCPPKRP